jgi:hypothetical protein
MNGKRNTTRSLEKKIEEITKGPHLKSEMKDMIQAEALYIKFLNNDIALA